MELEKIYEIINKLLGLDVQLLSLTHMALRGILVFLLGIAVIKANKRFIGLRTEFNFILFIMLGSLLATGITGNAPFFAVLGMAMILLALNWALIKLSYYWKSFEVVLKGSPILLIKNGKFQKKSMSDCSITDADLHAQLRIKHGIDDIHMVDEAYLETNGVISFLLKKQ